MGDELRVVERELAWSIALVRCLSEVAEEKGTPLTKEAQTEIDAILRPMRHIEIAGHSEGERSDGRVLSYLLETRDLCLSSHLLGGIESFDREVRLSCGIADFVVYHTNGSITVIELKSASIRREVAAGIGQVLMYAGELRGKGHRVQAMLVAKGGEDSFVRDACTHAGVGYLALSREMFDSYARVGAMLGLKNG